MSVCPSPITPGRALLVSCSYQLVLLALVATFIFFSHERVTVELLEALFSNWDARSYLSIAEHGYQPTGDPANFIVFFPLYPVLIRYLSYLFQPVIAGFLIATFASIAGHTLLILYLQSLGCTPKQVWRTIALFFVFPSGVFFTGLYTESLFLLCSIGTLMLLKRENYLWAGLAAFCAVLTRPVGVLLVVPFAFSLVRFPRFSIEWKALLPILFIPAAFCLYLGINYALHGDPFFYLARQSENWGKQLTNPFIRFFAELVGLYRYEIEWTHPLQLDKFVSLLAPLVIGLYCLAERRDSRALPPSIVAWTVAQCLLFLSQSFWLSNTRYFMLVWPLFVMVERITANHRTLYAVLLVGSGAYAIYAIYLFGIGWWAF